MQEQRGVRSSAARRLLLARSERLLSVRDDDRLSVQGGRLVRGGARYPACPVSGSLTERCGQLQATGDVELLERVSQVRFHGALGDEQALGDLAVGRAVGGEPGDAELAGG
jgi:hypothetical protein